MQFTYTIHNAYKMFLVLLYHSMKLYKIEFN